MISTCNRNDRTFYNCSGLKSVTFSDGVASIGSEAFSGCSGLKSVTCAYGDVDHVKSMLRDSGKGVDNLIFKECPPAPIFIPSGGTLIGEPLKNLDHLCGGKRDDSLCDGRDRADRGQSGFQEVHTIKCAWLPVVVCSPRLRIPSRPRGRSHANKPVLLAPGLYENPLCKISTPRRGDFAIMRVDIFVRKSYCGSVADEYVERKTSMVGRVAEQKNNTR